MNVCSSRNQPRRIVAQAFSLVEIMVASGIVGVLLVAVLAGISFGFSLLRQGRETQRANQILLEKLEELRLFNWSQVTAGLPSSFTEPYYPNATGALAGFNFTGAVSVSVAPLTQSYAGLLRQVSVSVTWASGDLLHTQSMTTLMASNAPLVVSH